VLPHAHRRAHGKSVADPDVACDIGRLAARLDGPMRASVAEGERISPVLRSGHREGNRHSVRSVASFFRIYKQDFRSAVARLLDGFHRPTDVDPKG
jgi:hypothetical protein